MNPLEQKIDFLVSIGEEGIKLSESARILLKLLHTAMMDDELKLACSDKVRDALVDALSDLQYSLDRFTEAGEKVLRLRPH